MKTFTVGQSCWKKWWIPCSWGAISTWIRGHAQFVWIMIWHDTGQVLRTDRVNHLDRHWPHGFGCFWDIHFLHIWFCHNCKTWWLSPLVLTWTWLTFALCFDLCLERFERPHVSTRTHSHRYSAGSCSTLKEKSAYRQSTACNSHPFSSSSLLGLLSWCVIPLA